MASTHDVPRITSGDTRSRTFRDKESALFGTIVVFGARADITVAEPAIESFFPADGATADLLRAAAASHYA